MLKNIQVSLRQYKGFNVPQLSHNLWVYYFTLPTSQSMSTVPKKSQLNAHYSNFNFADINMKILLTEGPAIESNPEESLPALLHFDQPISQHYFKFCSTLQASKIDKELLSSIVMEVAPHLMRTLLAYNFQIRKEMSNIENMKENTFFPFHYLTEFTSLVSVLLMTTGKTFDNFLFLLSPILELYKTKCQKSTLIAEASYEMFLVLLGFIEKHNCQSEELVPVVTFLIDTLISRENSEDKLAEFCHIILNNHSVYQFITDESYLNLLKKILNTFDKISRNPPEKPLFDIGISMLQALAATLCRQKQKIFNISPQLLAFLEWSTKFDTLPQIKVSKIKERTLFDKNIVSDEKLEFIDLDLFDESTLKEKTVNLVSISPIYLGMSTTLTNVVGLLSELCSKNSKVLEDIITSFPKKGVLYVYLTSAILFLCRPKQIGELFTKTNTWKIFASKHIINDFTLLNREGVDPFLVNMKDLILTVLVNSTSSEVAVALCNLVDPNYPTVVFKIAQYFNMLISEEFANNCASSPIFDTIMRCYEMYREYLILHKDDPENEDILYMKKAKSSILNFVVSFTYGSESKTFIFSNDRRVDFIISFLFEKKSFDAGLDIICRALEHERVGLMMKHLNKLFKVGSDFLKIIEWQELFSVLIDCISVSISTNEKNLIKSFIKTGSIYTFSKVPNAFISIDNGKTIVLRFLHKIICFFTSLVINMKNIIEHLSDPQWCFISNLSSVLRLADITEETVDLLISFTINGNTLWIKEGIELLLVAAEKDDLRDKVLSFLIDMTSNSIANRFQCFRANAITSLLHFIERGSSSASAFQLFKLISNSYYRTGELSLTVRLLSQTHEIYALNLLNVLLDINGDIDDSIPKSMFHFTPSSTFQIPPFVIPSSFTVSMNVYFPKLYEKITPFFVLSNGDNQKIIMNVMTNKFILEIKNRGKENQFQLFTKLSAGKWTHIDLSINTSTVTLYVNSELTTSSVIPKKFRFEKAVTFYIEHIEADVQYINIFSRENYFYSSFNAKIVNEGNVQNCALNSLLKNGEFYGLPIPFSIVFIDAVSSCGGPKIFLPLFPHIKSIEFFKQLLELLRSLIHANEEIFDYHFFRALAHVLIEVDADYYNSDIIELFFLIYKLIKSESIRTGMLRFIFGNFNLWSRINQDSQLLMYSGIFTSLLQIDPILLIKTLKFHEFLLKFTIIFEKSAVLDTLMQRATNFLVMLSQKSFTLRDAQILTSSLMYMNSNEMCLKSVFLVINLISDNSPAMVTFLRQVGFYQPFISIMNSRFERTRIIATNCLYFIQSIVNDTTLSLEMIDAIRMFNVTDMTPKMLYNLMAYITKSVNFKDFPTIVERFDYDDLKPIYFPQFLPLFANVIAISQPETIDQNLNYFRESITFSEESRRSFSKCNLWIFWFIFLGNVEKKRDEWLNLISLIILSNENVLQNILNLILVSNIFGIDTSTNVRYILNQSLIRKPSMNIALYVLKYILFPYTNTPNATVDDDSIHTFCQKFVISDCPKFQYKFSDKITNFGDLRMVIAAAKTLISQGHEFLLESSNLAGMNFTLICVAIRQIAGKNETDAFTLMRLLLPLVKQITLKTELTTGILLLHQFYRSNVEFETELETILKQLDPSFNNMNSDNVANIGDQAKDSFEREISGMSVGIQSEMNSKIAATHSKMQTYISHVFTEENQKLVDLRNSYTKQLLQASLESERFMKSNLKYYKTLMKKMRLQNGGPWFSIPSTPHFKFDSVLDSIGRHNKMAIKFNFNDHRDASLQRDTGSDSSSSTDSQKSMKTMKIEASDEVESPDNFSLELDCQMVTASKYYKGTMYVSQLSIYFEAKQTTDAFGDLIEKKSKLIEINVDSIKFILKRRYLFLDVAAELFSIHNRSFFFVFTSDQNRLKFFKEIESFKLKNLEFIQFGDAIKIYVDLKLRKKWSSGEISNYEYLYWLNILSGRSFHDISQYPVFPWVISDYKSSEIDLTNPDSFRDLAKPIGALNSERLANLRYLYDETKTTPYACLYRFHYTAPAYVIAFLLRSEPFTTLHIQLQNGKFDHPNRLFYSVSCAWDSVTSAQSDFRELIPEFYSTPEFLQNSEKFDLGYRIDVSPYTGADPSENSKELIQVSDESKASTDTQPQQKESDQNNDNEMKNDTNEVKNDTNEVKNDNNEVKNDTNEVKNDTNEVKNDTNEVKNDNNEVKNENNEAKSGNEVKNENDENNEEAQNKENSEASDGSKTVIDVVLQPIKSENNLKAPNVELVETKIKETSKIVKSKNGKMMVERLVKVDDVELPPWAPSAAAYVSINRLALESPLVSSTLHKWIDLIFGVKQRSIEANNLFHPFSYLSTLEKDPSMLPTVQQHAANFGITPFQLFTYNHQPRKYTPISHILNSKKQLYFKSIHLFDFDINILKIAAAVGTLYCLFDDKSFKSFGFNDKNQLVPLKTSQVELTSHLKPNRIFIDTSSKTLVMSPPWSQGFMKIHKATVFEPQNPHSTVVTAIATDGTYGVTGAGDSSLIVWNLDEEKIQCHIVAHTESISTLAISSELEIVVSCDHGGNMIFSNLKNGNFLRKLKFQIAPKIMHISNLGFVVSIFDMMEESGRNTHIVLTDTGGKILQELELEGKSTSSILINNQDYSSFLCIAQETKIVYILRIYDLKTVAMGPVNHIVKDMAYCKDDLSLYLLLDSYSIHITKLNV